MPTPKRQITVLLAEDHQIVRQGLRALLNTHGNFKILCEAKNGREAVDMAKAFNPDVILMDIAMPVLNGLVATRQILLDNPAARVVILSAHSDDAYIEYMNSAGAVGFLEKQTSAEVLARAINEVAKGNKFYSPSIMKRMKDSDDQPRDREGMLKKNGSQLSSREQEVLQLVAEGAANKQVAAILSISIKTVEKHRQNLMDKLNIHDTAGLTRYAISAGVIENTVHLTTV
ncbi:MAG: response regulator transcription factor [Verrucomicrobiota bacterium]|nr:response regulator transcription factor [Verrucomicrobiota bacterium]